MAAVTSDKISVYYGGIPIENRANPVPGALIEEFHECVLAANTTNTLTLTNITILKDVNIMFGTANNADMFATNPPYCTLSVSTLTIIFPNTPEAEAVIIHVWGL